MNSISKDSNVGFISNKRHFHHRWAVVATILLAILLRLISIESQSVSFDEAYTVAVGSATWPLLFQATLSSGVHPPLFYILSKLMLSLWGGSEFGARFMAIVPGLLTIPLIYQLGRVIFNRQTGMLAAVLLTINPLHVWLSQEARMYAALILMVTASMFFFYLALRTNQRQYWIGLLIVNALAFNLHYFSLLVPTVQFVVILSNFGRYLRQFRIWALIQFVAGAALLPWLIATALRDFQSFGIGFLQKPSLLDLPLTLWNFTIGLSWYFWWPVAGLAFLPFVLALIRAGRLDNQRFCFSQVMLFLWAGLPLILVWIISQRHSFYADRYLSFILPALILLVAFGASRVRQSQWRYVLITGLIIASGYGLVNTRFDPAFLKDNWREATAYIAQNEQPGDVILLYNTHIQIPFDYSYQGNLPRRPINLNLENFPIEPLTAGHQRAWVLYLYPRHPTHYPRQPLRPDGYWQEDPERNPLLVEWFETHSNGFVDYQHFRGIELWLVELDQADPVSKK